MDGVSLCRECALPWFDYDARHRSITGRFGCAVESPDSVNGSSLPEHRHRKGWRFGTAELTLHFLWIVIVVDAESNEMFSSV
jgi:hypothetical protein